VSFGEPRFDNPRAVQIRLPGFDMDRLVAVGRRVRDLFAEGVADPVRFAAGATDDRIERLARSVTGSLGGKVGVAPRIFLKKLVEGLLDRIDQHPDFDPDRDLPDLTDAELTEAERAVRVVTDPDEIVL